MLRKTMIKETDTTLSKKDTKIMKIVDEFFTQNNKKINNKDIKNNIRVW